MRVFVFVFVFALSLGAQEKGSYVTPQARAAITDIEITEVRIGRIPWMLAIHYRDSAGTTMIDYHRGVFIEPIADDPGTPNVNEANPGNPRGADVLVKALNKANLSTKSLECRAVEHLVSEGLIPAASCSGAPQ
jgi:hypothetical protein